MVSRYIRPPWYGHGGADDRHAMVEWQDGELEHESAYLEGRPCKGECCNRPEPLRDRESQAEWCIACGGTKGEGIFGMCLAHVKQFEIEKRKDRNLNAIPWAVAVAHIPIRSF